VRGPREAPLAGQQGHDAQELLVAGVRLDALELVELGRTVRVSSSNASAGMVALRRSPKPP